MHCYADSVMLWEQYIQYFLTNIFEAWENEEMLYLTEIDRKVLGHSRGEMLKEGKLTSACAILLVRNVKKRI